MRTIITGGTGLIGSHLARSLAADGNEVVLLSRQPEKNSGDLSQRVWIEKWDGRTAEGWGGLVEDAEVIINLAGENLAAGRWTDQRKKSILESRVNAGHAVVQAVKQAAQKPRLVIQSSAIGYYGNRPEDPATEQTPPAGDFLARVCQAWEESSQEVESLGVRRVIVRTGVILSTEGGPLPRMLLPMRLFVGGPLGDGRQWLSWIHLADEIEAIRFLIDHPSTSGSFNLNAPNPLRNREFMSTLGKVINRPSLIPAPAFAIRLLFGEMATIVLDGQKVIPSRLQQLGYSFKFKDAESALRDLLI
ncbi:MAG TPA: TIGR01777 family oxidoreductase [Anaerolineales bacterium]|nr:TIGR01777 family oxidoreductase [Anaerolineales bacterium]